MTGGRLAIVTSHPIQYQAPWFRALAREIDLCVFFCHRQSAEGQAAAGFGVAFEWDVPLLDGYEHRWLTNVAATPSVDTRSGCDTPGIADALDAGRFSACLVNGWYLKSYRQAVSASRKLGLPVLMRGDSQLKTPRSAALSMAKYVPYRWFLSTQIDAHLYVGSANRAYLEHYGVLAERLFFAPHFVENERFASAAASARANGAARDLRHEHGIGDDVVIFLFAGKLIDKKRPSDFVAALAQAARAGARVHGLIAGSGPLEHELRQQAQATGAPVAFAGFTNQSRMPLCYAAADCLVLPSDGRETWGLVVNEAMAAGVPAIVSDVVGCAPDLVTPAETGEIVPLGQIDRLADAIGRMARRSPGEVATMSGAVRHRIAQYSCDAATAGTLAALRALGADRAPALNAIPSEV